MAEELKIKLTAEVKDFKQNMEDAKTSMQETQEEAEETENRFQRFARQMGQVSPTFKKITDKWKDQQEKVGEVFGKNSKMAKLFKVTGVAAVAAIGVAVAAAVVKALEPAWRMAKETARMYDPQAYSKSAGAVEKATKRMKTAIGSFTSPIVNAVQNAFAKIIDGITWVIEKLRIGVAYITGILKAVFEPVVNGIRSVVTWVQGAINAIGVFIGIGEVFKEASKDAEDAADSIGEVVEATSAGLASFDKLTTLDFSGMGDAEEADKISDAISKAETDGKDLIKGINKWLENLDLGKVWDDFVKSCANAKDKVVEKLTEWFSGASRWASDMWDKFVSACGDVKNKIVSRITGWFSGASEWASGVWKTFADGCGSIKETISSKVGSWFSGASEWAGNVWQAFVDKLGEFKALITDKFASAVEGIPQIFSDVWEQIKKTFNDIFFKPIKDKINEIIDLMNKIPGVDLPHLGGDDNTGRGDGGKPSSPGSGGGSGSSSGSGSGILGGVGNVVNKVVTAISNTVNTVKDAASNAISGAASAIKSGAEAAYNAVANVGSTIANAASNAWNGFKGWLGLAGGGAVAPGNPQPYILGDNKREYEVVSPISLMEKTVMSALSKSGVGGYSGGSSSSSQSINLTVELDGKKIARAVYDPLETERKRRGMRA